MGLEFDAAYVVAVDTQPLVWAVHCDICDDIISEATTNGDVADYYADLHNIYHKQLDKQQSNTL
jgi:hypothetical protein